MKRKEKYRIETICKILNDMISINYDEITPLLSCQNLKKQEVINANVSDLRFEEYISDDSSYWK